MSDNESATLRIELVLNRSMALLVVVCQLLVYEKAEVAFFLYRCFYLY